MGTRVSWLLLALLSAAPASALDVSDARRFKCTQGNCRNGVGTAWDAALGLSMHGPYAGGATVAGETYLLAVPSAPNRKFELIYAADGLPERGSQPRAINIQNGTLPVFTGTYGRQEHPFQHVTIAPWSEGVYDTGFGVEYKGRFQFVPAPDQHTYSAPGYYVFYGDVVDHDENEQTTGLYVSDLAFSGLPVKFFKASPGYLAEMQDRYQASLSKTQTGANREQRESRWKSVLGVIGKIALDSATGSLSSSLGNTSSLGSSLLGGSGGGDVGGRIAMGLVSSMFSGKDSNLSVGDLTRNVIGATVADQGAGGAIASALLGGTGNGTNGAGGGGIAGALGSAVITQTGGVVGSAIASADAGVGGQIVGALAQGVFSSLAKGAAASATPTTTASGTSSPAAATGASSAATPSNSVVGTLGALTVAHTGNVVSSAIAGADAGVGGQVLGAATQGVFNSLARGVASTNGPQTSAPATPAPAASATQDQAVKGLQAMRELASAPKPAAEAPVLVPRTPTPPILPGARSLASSASTSPITSNAQLQLIAPPPDTSFASGRPFATNDGLYVRLSAKNGGTLAGKFTTGRGTGARWLTEPISKNGVGTFDVGDLGYEEVDSFDTLYIDPNGGQYRFGTWNMNNGGIQTNFELDIGARLKHFVPIARKQTYAARWAIGSDAVFHERLSRSTETKFSAVYDEIPVSGIQTDLFVTDDEGMTLYLAGSDLQSIVRISSDKTIKRFDMKAFGDGWVNTLIHTFDTLWIGYGSRVIALTGDKLTLFTNIDGLLPSYNPTFCIDGASMYLGNGELIQNISGVPSSPRPFLQTGKPADNPEDLLKLMRLKSAIGIGIYCAEEHDWGPHVYALAPDQSSGELRIFKIVPQW